MPQGDTSTHPRLEQGVSGKPWRCPLGAEDTWWLPWQLTAFRWGWFKTCFLGKKGIWNDFITLEIMVRWFWSEMRLVVVLLQKCVWFWQSYRLGSWDRTAEWVVCAEGRLGACSHLHKLSICKCICDFCSFFFHLWCANRGVLFCCLVAAMIPWSDHPALYQTPPARVEAWLGSQWLLLQSTAMPTPFLPALLHRGLPKPKSPSRVSNPPPEWQHPVVF